MAVLVPDRLAQPQKPKRKKLALVTVEPLKGILIVSIESISRIARRSNSFSFLTAFAAT